MNPGAIRLQKEARALFWPWCIVMTAGVLTPVPYLSHPLREALGFLGLFFGIPLLATLPFGNEFQYGTFTLLLSQPARRVEILREKLMVTAVAVVSTAAVFFYSWVSEGQWVLAGLYLVAATASAPLWTLSSRSTMGGLALSAIPVVLSHGIAVGLGVNVWEDLPAKTITVLFILALGYAGLT